MLREPRQAAMLAAQAIATADEHGFREVGWWARMSDGWAQTQLGHPDKGASLIGEALTAYRANGSLLWVTFFLTWLAEAQALDGALDDGLRTLEEALTVNPLEGICRPETLRVRGEIRRRRAEEEQAEADFHDAIALAREVLRQSLGIARRDELGAAVARSRPAGKGDRPARPDLWLVHRRLRHRRSERRESTARRTGMNCRL